ncbi:MAG: preprotein translocase subunit YajC [Ruminococcaceae bacterium]|nr:preprotein translocase subunit YajC [Oscillospiraceae bacterium]
MGNGTMSSVIASAVDTASEVVSGAGAGSSSSVAPQSAAGSIWVMVAYVAILGLAMYFLLIRPNKKKKKQEQALRDGLQVGDEIITIGGFYGRIMSIKDDSIVIESLGDRSKQRIAKWAIQQNLTIHDEAPKK